MADMNVDLARSDVSELVFHLYDRSVHPELFDTFAAGEIWHDAWSAVVRICRTGHTVSFKSRGHWVTEVTAARGNPLPQNRRLVDKPLRGCRDTSHRFQSGLVYQASFQLEQLDPEVFLNLHEELLVDCRTADLAHRFPTVNRLAPGPLSLIRVEPAAGSLLVHAFHTFPECSAVVKTQSLFEL